MTLGEIKVETLKLMFVGNGLSIDTLDELKNNEDYSDYLNNMVGAINRCFAEIENKRVLPVRSFVLERERAEIVNIKSNAARFDLSKIIPDYSCIDRLITENENEYSNDNAIVMEGDTLVIRNYSDNYSYVVVYYPAIERMTDYTPNSAVIDVPDKIAQFIPYFVKGDLFRGDEPNEANEARNWFEQAMNEYAGTKQSYSGSVKNKYSLTEI